MTTTAPSHSPSSSPTPALGPRATGRAVPRPARALRGVLAANATTSLVTGALGLAAAPWWADTLGLGSVGWTRLVSAGLLVFAIDVALLAWRGRALRTGALIVSIADLVWVAATLVALTTVDFTSSGRVVAVVVGIGVLDFALLQLWFRRSATD